LVGDNFDIEYYVPLLDPLPTLSKRNDIFSHPGPTPNGEYYVHSVCGEVRALIRNHWSIRYLVRWRGWEDCYNTIEPKHIIGPTAAFYAFMHPNNESGIGVSKSSLRSAARRTTYFDNINDSGHNNFNGKNVQDDNYFTKELKSFLKDEEKNKYFSKIVKFYG
jgi:hypothetical protein